jgi:hypothetical protein
MFFAGLRGVIDTTIEGVQSPGTVELRPPTRPLAFPQRGTADASRVMAAPARRDYGAYDALLVAALAFVGAVFFIEVRGAFGVDSWLALAAGREVWQAGIPHHDTLAALTQGHAWIDQQWLSQLTMYLLYRFGGLALVGLANVTLMMGGLAGAFVAARRLGAHARTMILVLPLCAFLLFPFGEVRTQAFAFPLFVTTVYVLASDSLKPSTRVYWCLPLLVLWANLHGSASLGAGLVALRGLTLAWERRHALTHELGAWRRPVALTIGAPICLFVTPYGSSIVSYYHATLFNGALKQAVTEWQPVTSVTLVAVPFFLLLGVGLWSFGRHPRQTTLWQRAALVLLGVAGIDALRNVSFFALAAVMIVGLSLDGAASARLGTSGRPRPRVNRAIAAAAIAIAIAAAVTTANRPAGGFESTQLQPVLRVVTSAATADRSVRVLADQTAADWLLWSDPNLRGRVAFDVRFELLSAPLLQQLERLYTASGPDWKEVALGYRLIVLDAKADPLATREFLAEPGRRILYDDGTYVVILRSRVAAD